MSNKENRSFRITVNCEQEIKQIFDIVSKSSKNKKITQQLAYGLLKQSLFYFLDELDCDLSFIDTETKHLINRVNCGIFDRQFKQTIIKNKIIYFYTYYNYIIFL